MLASLSGVIFIWKNLGKFIEKNLSFLVSFSAGVFLFITYLLSIETVHYSKSISEAIIWIIAGAIFFFILFKILPNFHHHHDEQQENEKHNKIDARRILISDGVHNIGDGILLTTSVIASPAIGVATAISIFIHEFVQEVSEFFVLRQAGFKIKKALIWNFAVSSTILIGAIGSYFLLETFEILEVPLLGIAAGSFLVVVINDLIPHSIRHSKNKTQYLKHLIWFILGLILMAFANSFFSHEHDVAHDHQKEHVYENHDHEYTEQEHDHEDNESH